MGLRRFRSVEEMRGPPPRDAGDSENLRIACGMSELARRLARLSLEPAIRRFRSYDELLDSRDQTSRMDGTLSQNTSHWPK